MNLEIERKNRTEFNELNTKVEHADTKSHDGSRATAEGFVANQFFGRYQILSVLGKGGMGTVYLSEDSLLGRKVALKIPRLRDADNETVERFYREARAAAGILHRNICPVFDVGKLDGQLYITMAYIDGEPLSKYINADRPPSARDIAITIRKLALALDHAHRAGIVHRDLKPANVMIDRSSEPVVMDFGLALQDSIKDVEKLTKTGMIMGTPAYMSPEQIRDSGRVGPSADIYSLGVILFQLLTGRLPFTGSVLTVCTKIVVEASPRPSSIRSGIDPELEEICLQALAKDPRERFESMAEFAESLNGFLLAEIKTTKDTMRIGNSPKNVYAASDTPPVLSAREVEARSTPQHLRAAAESSLLAPSNYQTPGKHLSCKEKVFSLPTWIFATISGVLTLAIFGGYVYLQPAKHELTPVAEKYPPSRSLNRGEIPTQPTADVFDRLKRAGAVISVLGSRGAPSVVRLAPDADLASAAAQIVEVNCVRFGSMTDDDLKALIERCTQLRKLALNASRITAKGFEPLVGSGVVELLIIRNDSSLSFGHLTQIGRLTELRVLGLHDCGVEDQGLALLSGLKNLESLNLTLNPLTGTGVELLARLPRLSRLSLSATTKSSVGLLQSVAALPGLNHLEIGIDGQTDLSPLADMHLVSLKLRGPKLKNLGAILGIRLDEIELTYDARIHETVLRSVTSLRTINGKPTSTFFSSS